MHHFHTLMRLHRALGHGLRHKYRHMGRGLQSMKHLSHSISHVGHGVKKLRSKLSFRY
jgi:hypothetical protein